MTRLLHMWIYRKLLVHVITQCFYGLYVAVSGERIAWNLQTTPAVFGSDIVLECILPNGTCCDRYTRRWLGGKNLNLLIMDGISSKPDKYSEEFTKESRLSKLIIHRLDSKDVNIPYQCTYGFSKDVKLLNMTDDNFENYPVEPVVFNIKQRGKVIQVYVVFQPVFPIPKCKASTYVRTSENDVDISKSMQISSVRRSLFYTVTLKIRYTVTARRCLHLLNITCQISTKLFETYKNITCSIDSTTNAKHRNRKMKEYADVG